MNNNYSIIRRIKERVLKNFYPVYHAPLIFDINTQSSYRKSGYVAWPNENNPGREKNGKKKEKSESMSGTRGYFAYPKNKLKIG